MANYTGRLPLREKPGWTGVAVAASPDIAASVEVSVGAFMRGALQLSRLLLEDITLPALVVLALPSCAAACVHIPGRTFCRLAEDLPSRVPQHKGRGTVEAVTPCQSVTARATITGAALFACAGNVFSMYLCRISLRTLELIAAPGLDATGISIERRALGISAEDIMSSLPQDMPCRALMCGTRSPWTTASTNVITGAFSARAVQ
mmetsp:Transcript_40739/g.95687  ORF Transcript_40739/g.95687 Transcript_40739/m.95687 type:complete len:205 (-) Transcript_40739:1144-1758(-)